MEKFKFFTRLHLSESLGLKAVNIEELLERLREVPGSCIYHHTHRYLQQHEYLSPEPPNDFAYWVSGVLGEEELGERLAAVDIVQFESIRELRERIISLIESYIAAYPQSKLRFAKAGKEFNFIKSISFIMPTAYEANNLDEFVGALEKIDVNSVYFHFFEARLRLENRSNDFSNWIENHLCNKLLADGIKRLDPYTFSLDGLRCAIIGLIKSGRY